MPDRTYANAGDSSLEEYKKMINTMMRGLAGRDANFTEEQWVEKYNRFLESANEQDDEEPDDEDG